MPKFKLPRSGSALDRIMTVLAEAGAVPGSAIWLTGPELLRRAEVAGNYYSPMKKHLDRDWLAKHIDPKKPREPRWQLGPNYPGLDDRGPGRQSPDHPECQEGSTVGRLLQVLSADQAGWAEVESLREALGTDPADLESSILYAIRAGLVQHAIRNLDSKITRLLALSPKLGGPSMARHVLPLFRA